MESPWEGRNHRVNMAKGEITDSQQERWKPQSHHGKVETDRVTI